jgi:hypothetical protein
MSVSSSFVLNPLLSLSVEPILRRLEAQMPQMTPNDPKWPFLRALFEPHFTKHQRNRGNFWNNGPKGPCFSPKPWGFYWYLAKIWPKSALNDPKNDPKLRTSIFGAVENNEIFAPDLHCSALFKVLQYVNAYRHEKCTSKCTILGPKWGHLGPLLGSY